MNDFVLRGFCNDCWQPIFLNEDNQAQHSFGVPCGKVISNEPVWFLSAKQMKIIEASEEFQIWVRKRYPGMMPNNEDRVLYLIRALESEPFLVAKILKQAGEKDEGENK